MMITKRSGFTLIEVIVYVAIFAMMISFVASILFRVGDSAASNRGRTSIEVEADLVMSKVLWAMSGASAITVPAASSSGSSLTVSKFGSLDNPISFELSSGTIYMRRAGGALVPITSKNVRVAELIFTHTPEVVSEPESLSIKLGIAASSSDPAIRASTSLQSTFYLKK
jgi:prepilin-type N-terminal cleavage/methylation domain-containing protein